MKWFCWKRKPTPFDEQLKQIRKGLETVMADINALNSKIAELKTQVDGIVPPTPQDFQPQIDQLQAIETELANKFPPVTPG